MYSLEDLGWGPFFDQQLDDYERRDFVPARVAEELRGAYRLISAAGDLLGAVPGRLMHEAAARDEYPAAGDWVLVRPLPGEDRGTIVRTLDRRTKLSRQSAGESTGEQVLAANVDTVFVVSSLNREFNLRRIERYLAAVWQSGAQPVVLLNKSDLCPDRAMFVTEVEAIAPATPVHAVSAAEGDGVDAVWRYLVPGRTAVFVGSSGVGKSTIINRLLDRPVLATAGIRDDDKGRHTTTSRQMLLVPGGGVIIDTPGLKVLALWDGGGLGQAFADVDSLADACVFRDCRHELEPGCAVRAAVTEGLLDEDRVRSYRKLERERNYAARWQDWSLQQAEKKKWKLIQRQHRQRGRVNW